MSLSAEHKEVFATAGCVDLTLSAGITAHQKVRCIWCRYHLSLFSRSVKHSASLRPISLNIAVPGGEVMSQVLMLKEVHFPPQSSPLPPIGSRPRCTVSAMLGSIFPYLRQQRPRDQLFFLSSILVKAKEKVLTG